MKKQRIIAGVFLIVLIGLVPPLRYLHNTLYKTHLLNYGTLGISFVIDRHDIATLVMIRRSEEEDSSQHEVPVLINNIIYPGEGVGSIGLGDSIAEVENILGDSFQKREYENRAYLWDSDKGIAVEFQDGELKYIRIWSKDYATEEGLRVGSKEDEIRAAYGQPKSTLFTITGSVGFSILSSLAYSILNLWILTLVLSLLSLYLRNKNFHREYLILIIASFFTAIIIYSNPLKIFMYGLEAYIMGFKPMLLWMPIVMTAPLVLVGILGGEIISQRKELAGFKKYACIICFATLGRIVAFIIVQLYGMVIMNSFYIYWLYSWLVIPFEGLLIYFVWVQFNRLFGIKRDYLMIE